MRRVLKFEVPVDDQWHWLHMPAASNIVHVGVQGSSVYIWVDVIEECAPSHRRLRVFGTGHEVPFGASYIGTAQCPGIGFVWHVFEEEAAQ